jgi:hypothetical protein
LAEVAAVEVHTALITAAAVVAVDKLFVVT